VRVGVIADIHANAVAFDTVVDALDRERLDTVLCLGDVALSGPQPRECLERLQERGWPTIMGNSDAAVLAPTLSKNMDEDSRRVEEIDFWCMEQLSASDRSYIATFKPVIEMDLGGVSLLAFHGSPRSNRDIITATTRNVDLAAMISSASVDVLVGGHTHTPMLRRYRGSFLLNPGSVGLPFLSRGIEWNEDAWNPPWAEYLLLSVDNGVLDLQFRRVPIDVDAVLEAARRSSMPHVQCWCKDWQEPV